MTSRGIEQLREQVFSNFQKNDTFKLVNMTLDAYMHLQMHHVLFI